MIQVVRHNQKSLLTWSHTLLLLTLDLDADKKSSTDNLDYDTKATAKELIAEQLSDSSLSTWALANKNKGGYVVKDGILFHKGIIAGQSCEQLCVPVSRRQSLPLVVVLLLLVITITVITDNSQTYAAKGYYQTPVREEDWWLTAFVCEFGLFEFTRTPFGMRSSGATFVRAIQMLLQPVSKFTASYVSAFEHTLK